MAPEAFDPKKVYIGGCMESNEDDIIRTFGKYGTVERIWVARSPPGFAFVWYADARDADAAVAALDGSQMGGQRCTVAIASSSVIPP